MHAFYNGISAAKKYFWPAHPTSPNSPQNSPPHTQHIERSASSSSSSFSSQGESFSSRSFDGMERKRMLAQASSSSSNSIRTTATDYYQQGQQYFAHKDYENALKSYESALLQGHPNAVNGLIEVFQTAHHWNKNATQKDLPDTIFQLGKVYENGGLYDRAIA